MFTSLKKSQWRDLLQYAVSRFSGYQVTNRRIRASGQQGCDELSRCHGDCAWDGGGGRHKQLWEYSGNNPSRTKRPLLFQRNVDNNNFTISMELLLLPFLFTHQTDTGWTKCTNWIQVLWNNFCNFDLHFLASFNYMTTTCSGSLKHPRSHPSQFHKQYWNYNVLH